MSEEIAPRQRGMTPLRFTLAAGVPKSWNVQGDYFHVYTAPVDDLVARFDNGEPVPVREGVGFRRYYGEVSLESATGQAVIVLAGFGSVADGRATVNATINTTVVAANTIDNGGDVSCAANAVTQLLAADATRTYALLKNVSTNTLLVRIGDVSVDGTSGIPLEPGETLPYATTAAVYAFNPSLTTAVTINAASLQEV